MAGVAAAIGVFHPAIFRDAPMTAGNARGTTLVILVVALPTVAVSMYLAARGSLRARITWLGALGYILYNSLVFAFATAFNPLFLLYVAALSLTLWSLVTLLTGFDIAGLAGHVSPRLRVRMIGGYLVAVTLLFFVAWMRDIVPALLDNGVPASLEGTKMLTNPIEVMDLSAAFPLQLLAGIWLWRRRPWGYLLSGLFLVMLTIEGVSVTADQIFGHISDPSQPLSAVPLFAALAVVGLVPTVAFLRGVRGQPSPTRRGAAPAP